MEFVTSPHRVGNFNIIFSLLSKMRRGLNQLGGGQAVCQQGAEKNRNEVTS